VCGKARVEPSQLPGPRDLPGYPEERIRELEEAEYVARHCEAVWLVPRLKVKMSSLESEALKTYAAWWNSHRRWQDVFPQPVD